MNAQALEIYEIFKKTNVEDEARRIIAYIEDIKDKKITAAVEKKIENLATKADLAKLDLKVSDTKSEMIKWMFIFWLGQIGVSVGMIMLLLKK